MKKFSIIFFLHFIFNYSIVIAKTSNKFSNQQIKTGTTKSLLIKKSSNSNSNVTFKTHTPCSFSIKLPSTFKFVSQDSETSLDYCNYEVRLKDGSIILEVNSLLKTRFTGYEDFKDGESEIKYLYRKALNNSELEITYKIQKDNWFVISGINKSNGKLKYWKRVLGSNFISDLTLEYNKSNSINIEPYLGKISSSFLSF
jgi:hypothetical protein